ncbi:hypothetical protein DET50_10797 [Marinobacter pelagius]|uniref:Lipoprotein n=1 Tax=Marinobacter pelagius TaxID=379482 RepID=A0A366GUE4_9GAMM|nr:hypothetical protein [Marinobacter pelagius]RBP30682.1 hypothetical protein DET50_10797 [Marinobacter pelagius]
MKYPLLVAVAATTLLSGCQTSTYMSSAATDGDGVTCNEIYQAFDAYSRDRQSASAWAQLSSLISPTASNYAEMGVNTASKYYDQIRASANLALSMRGCQPISQ